MMRREYEIPYIENLRGDEEQVVIIAHGFGSSMQSPTAQMVLENLPRTTNQKANRMGTKTPQSKGMVFRHMESLQ